MDSRGEGVVLLHTADAFTFALLSLGLVVEVELIQAVSKCQQDLRRGPNKGICVQTPHLSQISCYCEDKMSVYQTVDEEELQDVQQHSPQRDLQRPQVRVGREQRDEAQRAENVGDGKHGLGHESRVPHLPLVPGFTAVVLRRTTDRERMVTSSASFQRKRLTLV